MNTTALMPKDTDRAVIPVMTPPAISPVVTISAAGNVDVSNYSVIKFGSNLNIYWGADSSNTWPYIANDPLGIAQGVTTINVDAACKMLVM